jgi:hypothetical protein
LEILNQSGDRRDSIQDSPQKLKRTRRSPGKSLRMILDLVKQFSRQPRVDLGTSIKPVIYHQLKLTSEDEIGLSVHIWEDENPKNRIFNL